MPVYSCRVGRADGTVTVERIEAESAERATARLQELGYLIFSVRPRFTDWSGLTSRSTRFGLQEFLIFNQELSALLKAGIPILRTLDLLIDRSVHPGFRDALTQVRDLVKGGASLSEAMGRFPVYFSDLYVASLRSGEQTGHVVEVIARHLAFLRRMAAVKGKVRSAMAYPIFLVSVGLVVITFLMLYVVPSFAEVYRDARVELPLLTRVFLAFVQVVRHQGLWVLGGIALLAVIMRVVVRKAQARTWWHRWLLRVPVLGRAVRLHYLVGMTRTLAMTLQSGIPLVAALRMVQASSTNLIFTTGVAQVTEAVVSGSGLAQAIGRVKLLPRMSVEMIEIGETAGALPDMLNEVSEFHEGELDRLLSRLMTWIEPTILLIMGGLVAIIVIAMYLPIFYLAGTIQ
ncbi:MAG TPA: type II secretion system F family protein [Nitrospiria bacterium]|nr:type II secretion system F family protein [Nitrospiria bacterium]